jgi:hypothetical protein
MFGNLCPGGNGKGSGLTPFNNLSPNVQALFPAFVASHYEIHEWRHAASVFTTIHPQEWAELMDVLTLFRLKKSYIVKGGGNKSKIAIYFDTQLGKYGWREVLFDTTVDVAETSKKGKKITILSQVSYAVPTHKVDVFKNAIALEVEWNNKDPFFDRDLNNFRLLFDLRTVDVGVIVTRTDALQDIFDDLNRGDSYGASTTHMSKLLPKIDGGGAGGCPVLVFGIKPSLFVDDHPVLTPEEQAEAELIEQAEAIMDEEEEE